MTDEPKRIKEILDEKSDILKKDEDQHPDDAGKLGDVPEKKGPVS